MREFEREGQSTVKVEKVNYDGTTINVKVSEGDQIKTMASAVKPHKDFVKAVDRVSEIFRVKLGMSWAPGIGIVATGVEYEEKNDCEGFAISGNIEFPYISARSKVKTPLLYIAKPGYWEQTDNDGNLIHKPSDYPRYLTDDDENSIEAVFTEALFLREQG